MKKSDPITELAATLFTVLRQMGAEAGLTPKGSPTGLNWYGGFSEPHNKRPRTEVSWSRRTAELLPANGFPTSNEVRYPSLPRCKCDDVITLSDGRKLWLEVKGAWKDYWTKRGGTWMYRSYLLHPLVPGLDQSRTHTVPLDLKKLETIPQRAGNLIGVLLIGFDTEEASMKDDIAELTRLAGLDQSPWTTASDEWADRHREGTRIHCWLWLRPVLD